MSYICAELKWTIMKKTSFHVLVSLLLGTNLMSQDYSKSPKSMFSSDGNEIKVLKEANSIYNQGWFNKEQTRLIFF